MFSTSILTGIIPVMLPGLPPDFVTPPPRTVTLGARGPNTFDEPMDPTDVVDFAVVLTQGDTGAEFLAAGEQVASFDLSPSLSAAAAGLIIRRMGDYGVVLVAGRITFWVEIAGGVQASQQFNGAGRDLGIELTAVTDSTPPRTRQRTLIVKVLNQ